MEGTLGPFAAKLDANVRVVRGTCLSPGVVNTSTQFDTFAALPAGQNAVFLGAAAEDRFETGFAYVAGTDPSTVTGTTPASPYNLATKPIGVVRRGRFPLIAFNGNIKQGDAVVIADAFGRVQSYRDFAAGQDLNSVGVALNPSSATNDIVEVDVGPFHYRT